MKSILKILFTISMYEMIKGIIFEIIIRKQEKEMKKVNEYIKSS
ncbi:transcriptional activator RinB [Staphylococcus equorum]|nr:hypothetical protein [Staphylococcus equorum]